MHRKAFSLVFLLAAASCAPAQVPPEAAWRAGDRQGAVEAQRARAAEPSRQQALDQLDLASMLLAQGDTRGAEGALRKAVGTMTDFRADGEFAAVIGAEDRKEWKGEPYEKMAAYLTLGVLLHQQGDRGNALAMYKSAVLADTGTAAERYRSDFVPAWIMQGLAYQAEGEPENARQFIQRGVDALWSRDIIALLTDAIEHSSAAGTSAQDAALAKGLLLTALSAGATAAPRDPVEAARATISTATDLARIQRDTPKKERLAGLQDYSGRDFQRAADALPAVAEAWVERARAIPEADLERDQRFAARMDSLLERPPSVVLLVERGRGPHKIRTGEHGEVLTIVPSQQPATRPAVTLDGHPIEPAWLDDLAWQATTRGGRGVDGFLQGKAIYKDASVWTGYAMMRTAELLDATDHDDLAMASAVIGVGLMISGALTNPAADVREWSLAPAGWYLVTANPAPGEHTLTLDSRPYTLDVPADGQLVALIPSLPPGGAQQIGP